MKTRRRSIAHNATIKQLATGLLLLALVLQGYLSQVHFHQLRLAALQGTADAVVSGGPIQPAEAPANRPDHHNDKCFVCHLTGLGSISVEPPNLVLRILLPLVWVFASHGDIVILAQWTAAHAPRGPPVSVVQA